MESDFKEIDEDLKQIRIQSIVKVIIVIILSIIGTIYVICLVVTCVVLIIVSIIFWSNLVSVWETMVNFIVLNLSFLVLYAIFLVVYVLRNIHYRIEKRKLDDDNIEDGFSNLLTIFNLGYLAERSSGTDLVTIEDGEMDVEDAKIRYFISEKFTKYFEKVFYPLFGGLPQPEEVDDDSEGENKYLEKKKGIKYYLDQIYDIALRFTPIGSFIGGLTDIFSLIMWFILINFYWFYAKANNANYRQLYNSVFFFTTTFAVYGIGLFISVLSTVFMYYEFYSRVYFVKIKNRSDDEISNLSWDDNESFDVDLSILERVGLVVFTFLSIPVLMLCRFLQIDTIIHCVKRIAMIFVAESKVAPYIRKERVYTQQAFYWDIGKHLPTMILQYFSAVLSFCLFLYELYDKEYFIAITLLISVVSSAYSSHTSFIMVSLGMIKFNNFFYSRRGIRGYLWRGNFFILQASLFIMRLTPLLFIAFNILILYRFFDISVGWNISLFIYGALGPYFLFLIVSFCIRVLVLFLCSLAHAIKKVRFGYALLYAARTSILLEAFASNFGGIANGNPTLSFALMVFINVTENYTLTFINYLLSILLITMVYVIPQEDGSISDSAKFADDPPTRMISNIMNFTNIMFVVNVILYLVSLTAHLLLFPVFRTQALVFKDSG